MGSLLSLLAVAGCRLGPPPLTAASLQGDWAPTSEDWGRTFAYPAVSVQGDSIRLFREVGDGWSSFVVHADTLVVYRAARFGSARPADTLRLAASVTGDTLRLSGEGQYGPVRQALARRRVAPGAARPDRVALSAGYCYGLCPSFDVEIDSTGAVRYHGRFEVPIEGDYDAAGARALFQRVAEAAAAVRADSVGRTETLEDDHDLAVLVWYDGKVRVHRGTLVGFHRLMPLVAELSSLPHSVALVPSGEPLSFESRDHIYHEDQIPEVDIDEELLEEAVRSMLSASAPRRGR